MEAVSKRSREALEAMVNRTGWVLDPATSGCSSLACLGVRPAARAD